MNGLSILGTEMCIRDSPDGLGLRDGGVSPVPAGW